MSEKKYHIVQPRGTKMTLIEAWKQIRDEAEPFVIEEVLKVIDNALNELHKVKCELGQYKSRLIESKLFAQKAYQEGYEMHKFEMSVEALIKNTNVLDEFEKTKKFTHEQALGFLNDIVRHGNCDFTNIQSMAYDELLNYINQQAGIIYKEEESK
jgi:hypothetical protein